MSHYSAVRLVADWWVAHDRPPTSEECRATNGLPHYTRLLKYGAWPKALDAASTLAFSPASAALVARLQPAHACRRCGQPVAKGGATAGQCRACKQPCLRCGTPIAVEGPHVRQCRRCRQAMFNAPAGWQTPWGALPESSIRYYRDTGLDDPTEFRPWEDWTI